MYILGVSAFYHDSAACLIKDGEIVGAVQEEAFSRIKHDASFPSRAIEWCLKSAGADWRDLSYVGFYELPHLKLSRIAGAAALENGRNPKLIEDIFRQIPESYKDIRFAFPRIRRGAPLIAIEHHLSHASSAFYPSPFEEAAIMTVDGVGEYTTTSLGTGRGNDISILLSQSFPHSLGLLYSAFTYYCGFSVNDGEYKLMGLAPYGTPKYSSLIEETLIRIANDGSYRLNMDYFAYLDPRSHEIIKPNFAHLFNRDRRHPDAPLDEFYADVAASAQEVFEKVILRIALKAKEVTRLPNLCFAGGAALNCVANAKVRDSGAFERVWVQPAASDAGGALGVASYIWFKHLGNTREPAAPDAMRGALLGPGFSDEIIRQYLDSVGATYETLPDTTLIRRTADLLEAGKIVGLFRGRMEYGPRALGSRSILADPRSPRMQQHLNMKIKLRESFRPFAPAVVAEEAGRFFELKEKSPYMLFVAAVSHNVRCPDCVPPGTVLASAEDRPPISRIPAVTHVDYTARVQTVDRGISPFLWELLTEFGHRTGFPILVNTSFNVRGEPIVCTPEDAMRCFLGTEMDWLVIGNHLLFRDDQQDVRISLGTPT